MCALFRRFFSSVHLILILTTHTEHIYPKEHRAETGTKARQGQEGRIIYWSGRAGSPSILQDQGAYPSHRGGDPRCAGQGNWTGRVVVCSPVLPSICVLDFVVAIVSGANCFDLFLSLSVSVLLHFSTYLQHSVPPLVCDKGLTLVV